MRRGREVPLKMTIAAIIKTVAPSGAALKWVESNLDCSPRQAKRIVSENRVPGRFRAALITILEEAIRRNRTQLERLEDELKRIRYGEMVDRAAARRAAAVGPDTSEVAGFVERAGNALPVNDEGD